DGDLVAFAYLAEHVLERIPGVVEDQRGGRAAPQPELVLLAPGGEPARAPLDDEGGELVPVYLEEHHVDVSEAAVGDPHLSAVDQVMRSVFREASHRLRTEGIRTAAG